MTCKYMNKPTKYSKPDIDPAGQEADDPDCSVWRMTVKAEVQISEEKREEQWEEKREQRQQRAAPASSGPGAKFHLQQLQQSLLFQDHTVEPQQAL